MSGKNKHSTPLGWLRSLLQPRRSQSSSPTGEMTFEEWFSDQPIEFFRAEELTRLFKRRLNSYPPREYWPRIVPVLRVLDELRSVLDQPISINSAYRAKPYNDMVGSTDGSRHLQFDAIDFSVRYHTSHEVFKLLKEWRASGMFKGGLGLYRTFVHIDNRGYNATWGLGQ